MVLVELKLRSCYRQFHALTDVILCQYFIKFSLEAIGQISLPFCLGETSSNSSNFNWIQGIIDIEAHLAQHRRLAK